MCSLEKRGDVYILTLTGAGEHRLNPTLLGAIQAALRRVRSEVTAGSTCSALITTAEGKFFSNGFDLGKGQGSSHRLLVSKIKSVMVELIHLPMPTIAAVTGHASAAGFFLALSHDYILMRNDRGFLYVGELDMGLVIPEWTLTLLRSKVSQAMARRQIVLGARKLTAKKAMEMEMGVIDSAHNSAEETVEAAVKLGEELVGRKRNGQVYAQTRANMFADVLGKIRCDEAVEGRATSKL